MKTQQHINQRWASDEVRPSFPFITRMVAQLAVVSPGPGAGVTPNLRITDSNRRLPIPHQVIRRPRISTPGNTIIRSRLRKVFQRSFARKDRVWQVYPPPGSNFADWFSDSDNTSRWPHPRCSPFDGQPLDDIFSTTSASNLQRLSVCLHALGGTPSDLPPSMAIAVPLTMVAASLTKYSTACAISCGSIIRL